MRLSTVFELLLIFLLIAFAAYGRVIDGDEVSNRHAVTSISDYGKQENIGVSIMSLKQATENVNKYCNCNENICNCCRDFNIPVVALKGPGCASLQYRDNDSLAVQLNFGNNILTSKIISGKKSQSICVPMLGGFSKFCGRIYSIERESSEHFKACLGLELQSSTELEASLRVSCFRFGPDGVKLRPAEQFPIIEPEKKPDDDDDDDDDDDLFSLDDDDDDDDDDDEDYDEQLPSKNTAALASTTGQQTGENEDEDDDDDDDDILGFGALFDIITGGDDSNKKKTTTAAPILPFTIPIIVKPTTVLPIIQTQNNPVLLNNVSKQPNTIANVSDFTTMHSLHLTNLPITTEIVNNSEYLTTDKISTITESVPTTQFSHADNITVADVITEPSTLQPVASNVVKYITRLDKPSIFKRITVGVPHKKFSETSNSANAIKNDVKKPVLVQASPIESDTVHKHPENYNIDNKDKDNINNNNDDGDLDDDDDDEEDDDDYESEENSVEDIDEDGDETALDDEDEDETVLNDEDDDDEEEDAVLSALISDEKDNDDKLDKVANISTVNKKPETSDDYNVDFEDLLSKKRHIRRGRQSKVMRL